MTKKLFRNIIIAMVLLCAIAVIVSVAEHNRNNREDIYATDYEAMQQPSTDDIDVDYTVKDGAIYSYDSEPILFGIYYGSEFETNISGAITIDYVVTSETSDGETAMFGFNESGEIYVGMEQVAYNKDVAKLLIDHFILNN